ncbi:MAG: hypothetical protein ACKN87_16620 [Microcystis aeruginosa]
MNYPAASGRGIRIKIDSIVDFGVAAGILYLVLLHPTFRTLKCHIENFIQIVKTIAGSELQANLFAQQMHN